MCLIRKLFGYKKSHYLFKLIEFENGEARFTFTDENGLTYELDLDWDSNVMDIEFGLVNDKAHNTTNLHRQYKVLRTVSYIVKLIIKRIEPKIKIISFKSSDNRDGIVDLNSMEIRTKFFIRYIIKEYPQSTISRDDKNIIYVKLNK